VRRTNLKCAYLLTLAYPVFAPVTLTLTDDLDIKTWPRYSAHQNEVSIEQGFLKSEHEKTDRRDRTHYKSRTTGGDMHR